MSNRWRGAWLVLGVAVGGFACWALYDLRADVKRTTAGVRETNAMVKEKLPPILENSRRASEALVKLTDDIGAIRTLVSPLAGEGGKAGPVAQAKFAEKLLSLVQAQAVMVHSKGASPRTAADWARGERKEVLYLAFSAGSKREVFDKVCATAFGNPWMVSAEGKGGEPMRAWLLRKHPDIEKELE